MSGLLSGIEVWQMALALVAAITAFALLFVGAMARFLKRPSPSEAIMRIGRTTTDVFIGRACWIVPVLHRAATMSLSTIGLTIRREGHEALVTKDFISTNLSAEFYIRVEPTKTTSRRPRARLASTRDTRRPTRSAARPSSCWSRS